MSSFVDLYVYEVRGPRRNNFPEKNENFYLHFPYSFNKLSLRENTNINNPIVPLELRKVENKEEEKLYMLYSKNIIKDKNNKNTEINTLYNNNNIPFLYKIYKTLSARTTITIKKLLTEHKLFLNELKNNIYSKISELFRYNTHILSEYTIKYSLNKISEKYLKENVLPNLNSYNVERDSASREMIVHRRRYYSEIIYNIYEEDSSKIIVIGDNHGSFHSFFRIILRLYIKGIINKQYELKKNYKIILLGNIIDKGSYGTEILYILLNLMKKNNTTDKLNVILIRGLHEDLLFYRYNTFIDEIQSVLKNPNNMGIDKYDDFFIICPSAVILNHSNTRYWLCNGGFIVDDYKGNINKNTQFSIFKKIHDNLFPVPVPETLSSRFTPSFFKSKPKPRTNIKQQSVLIIKNKKESQIRGNSFSGNDLTEKNRYAPEYYIIGNNDLKKFMEYLQIDFIIKGGEGENIANAMILCKENKFFILNNYKMVGFYLKFFETEKDILFNYKINENKNTLYCDDEIVSIDPKKFNKDGFSMKNTTLFPVLYLANNSDQARNQYSDSFIIISDKNETTTRNSIYNNKNNRLKNNLNSIRKQFMG
jgi:hypothetical protein